MVTENQTETVVKDLKTIQQRFIHENRRFMKNDLLEKFINDESLSQEARDLTSAAVDRLYEDVVWDDDVFGNHVTSILEVLIVRYRRMHS